MPRPALRSRSLRRVKRKKPNGKVSVSYERRKPNVAKCAICKKPLKGMPRRRPSQLRKLAKSKRKPERPFGGNTCSNCTRQMFKEELHKLISK